MRPFPQWQRTVIVCDQMGDGVAARVLGLRLLIAALAATAIAAIAVIIAGDLGHTAGKVLLTTLFVPVYFSTAIVQGSLIRRRGALAALGWLGVAVSAAAFLAALYLIWHDEFEGETAARIWGALLVASIAAASLALLISRQRPGEAVGIRVVFFATIGATLVLAALSIYAIATVDDDADALSRAIGVASVVWALGITLLPALRAASDPATQSRTRSDSSA
jgi:hypothetical protein